RRRTERSDFDCSYFHLFLTAAIRLCDGGSQPMKRLLLVIVLAASTATAQNKATIPADLTLKQALDIALANNSTLKEAQAELQDMTTSRFKKGYQYENDANSTKHQVNSNEQKRKEAEQSYVETKLNLAEHLQTKITAEFEVTDEAAYGSRQPMDRQTTIQAAL